MGPFLLWLWGGEKRERMLWRQLRSSQRCPQVGRGGNLAPFGGAQSRGEGVAEAEGSKRTGRRPEGLQHCSVPGQVLLLSSELEQARQAQRSLFWARQAPTARALARTSWSADKVTSLPAAVTSPAAGLFPLPQDRFCVVRTGRVWAGWPRRGGRLLLGLEAEMPCGCSGLGECRQCGGWEAACGH